MSNPNSWGNLLLDACLVAGAAGLVVLLAILIHQAFTL